MLTAALHLILGGARNTEQVEQLAGMMQQQLDQLVRLIDDLVDVHNSGTSPACGPTRVAEFIDAAVAQSRPLMDAARHTFHVSLPDNPIVVSGDKVRLAKMISNLLINAAKYTPPGRVAFGLTVPRRTLRF